MQHIFSELVSVGYGREQWHDMTMDRKNGEEGQGKGLEIN